jgi:hypothetical protein
MSEIKELYRREVDERRVLVLRSNGCWYCLEAGKPEKQTDVADNTEMAMGSEVERLQARVEQLTGHLDWIGWSSDGIEKAKAETESLRISQRSDEEQLCRIASYLGKDARHGPEGDKTIAGLVIAEIEQLRAVLDRLLHDAQRNGFIGDNLDDAIAWATRQMGESFRLRAEVELLRVQLVACDVIALSNTPETFATNRLCQEHEAWSAAYVSVCDAVEREMALRQEVARLLDEADKAPEWKERAEHFFEQSEQQRVELEAIRLSLSLQIAEAEIERLRMLVLSARDAMNEYHLTKTSKALDELTRIAGMCNRSELLDVPYVRSVIEAETADLRRRLIDAEQVRDQRWKMVKESKAEIERLQAIVDRLPKTADGAPITQCMKLFYAIENATWEVESVLCLEQEETQSAPLSLLHWELLHSTREAAERARE